MYFMKFCLVRTSTIKIRLTMDLPVRHKIVTIIRRKNQRFPPT